MPLIETFDSERAWLGGRMNGIGASEIGSALDAEGSHETPRQLWCRKVGLPHEPKEVHDRMRWGQVMEPLAAAWYADLHGPIEVCEPFAVYRSESIEWLTATPDARTDYAVIDFKLLHPMSRAWDNGAAPLSYRLQIQQQMMATGLRSGVLVGLVFQDRMPVAESDWPHLLDEITGTTWLGATALSLCGVSEVLVRHFEWDDALARVVERGGGEMWARICGAREKLEELGGDWTWDDLREWEPEAREGDFGDLRQQYPGGGATVVAPVESALADEILDAHAAKVAAERRFNDAKAKAMQAAGDAEEIQDETGRKVATWKTGKRGRTFRVATT